MSAKVNSNSGIKSPGRRAMRAMMKARTTIVAPVYIDSPERAESARIWGKFMPHTNAPHKDGNRATRRAALKTARTKQRQASREYQGLAPVEIAIVKRRKAEQAARKAVRAPKVSQ